MKSRKAALRPRRSAARAPVDLLEVLDRVLDRGIVIDAWLRVSLVGLRLVDVDARIVVASIKTYVREGEAIATPAERPAARSRRARRARRRRPARIMLRCAEGCTFLRAASSRRSVRCASEPSRVCPISAIAA